MSSTECKRIKLLHVINTLDVGGAERMLVKLLAGLDPAIFENTVVTLTGDGVLNDAARETGARVEEIGMSDARDMPRALLRLRRIVAAERPDIVQSWLYQSDLLATMAHGAAVQADLVWTLRCTDMALERYGMGTRIVRRLLAWLSHRPDLVLANSHAGLDWHRAFGYRPRHTEIIPNGFDLGQFHPDPVARAEVRTRLGVPANALVVGAVARLDPMKGYDTFLAAVERLAKKEPRLHVVVVGKDTETLNPGPAALVGRFHALGVSGDIQRILPSLDVFCLASGFGEGFPNVLGEAMACGVPAVVTDVGDAALILGDCGRVVPPGDEGAFSAAVAKLLALPDDERQTLGHAARARIAAHYEIETVVARFTEVYRRLAATKPN